jgi:hypothetical protein
MRQEQETRTWYQAREREVRTSTDIKCLRVCDAAGFETEHGLWQKWKRKLKK